MSGRVGIGLGWGGIASSVKVFPRLGTNSGAVARRSEAMLEGTDMSLGVGLRARGIYCVLLPRVGDPSVDLSTGLLRAFVVPSSCAVSVQGGSGHND